MQHINLASVVTRHKESGENDSLLSPLPPLSKSHHIYMKPYEATISTETKISFGPIEFGACAPWSRENT